MDMAKKKHSAAAATTTEKTTETAPAVAARDASPEKVLQETVERREQVRQLLSRIDDLAIDHSFLSARELDAAEKEVRSLSEALKQADEKLNLAAREKEEIENRLDSVVSERDSIRKDAEWEIFVSVVDETLEQLRIMIGGLLLLLESKEEAALQFLVREKNAIEVKLEEQQAQVESLVAEKEVFEVKISALEERHRCLVGKNQRLQCELHSLKHERLLMEFSSLEKEEKEEIQKALRLEKLVEDLKKIEEDVTRKLKSQVEKLKKIEDAKTNFQELSRELGLLQPALVEEEQKKKKKSVWIWLHPVITTVITTVLATISLHNMLLLAFDSP